MDESKKAGWSVILTFFQYLFKGVGNLFMLVFKFEKNKDR